MMLKSLHYPKGVHPHGVDESIRVPLPILPLARRFEEAFTLVRGTLSEHKFLPSDDLIFIVFASYRLKESLLRVGIIPFPETTLMSVSPLVLPFFQYRLLGFDESTNPFMDCVKAELVLLPGLNHSVPLLFQFPHDTREIIVSEGRHPS
mmetsp:Transcript_9802/g.19972  ORF Transcript_9802/g.19972 Transcript_9802/m.19972 type:complete len:149 (-) Transcript_9802:1159-1605(-)